MINEMLWTFSYLDMANIVLLLGILFMVLGVTGASVFADTLPQYFNNLYDGKLLWNVTYFSSRGVMLWKANPPPLLNPYYGWIRQVSAKLLLSCNVLEH